MKNNIIKQIEAEQMQKEIPDFRAGDTVAVQVKVKEGSRERLQTFEGVVIAKRNRSLNSSFIVRKISNGEGVERTFQTYSPTVATIKVVRRGHVHKAKLYHLRELSGRAARIKERIIRKKDNGKTEAKKPVKKKTKEVEAKEAPAQANNEAAAE